MPFERGARVPHLRVRKLVSARSARISWSQIGYSISSKLQAHVWRAGATGCASGPEGTFKVALPSFLYLYIIILCKYILSFGVISSSPGLPNICAVPGAGSSCRLVRQCWDGQARVHVTVPYHEA